MASERREVIAVVDDDPMIRLLLDVQLGAMTGIELARHLISTGFSFPTIFMTGSKDESYQRDGIAVGCVKYLHKPFPASRLICAIDKALGPL